MDQKIEQAPEIEELSIVLRMFAEGRNWRSFHTPKNLSMALAGEAGELLEHFQWLSEEESDSLSWQQAKDVSFEIADIMIYLIMLADRLDIDLMEVCRQKIKLNAQKYPAS